MASASNSASPPNPPQSCVVVLVLPSKENIGNEVSCLMHIRKYLNEASFRIQLYFTDSK